MGDLEHSGSMDLLICHDAGGDFARLLNPFAPGNW